MASMYQHMLTMQRLLDVVESVACMYPYMRQAYLISVTAREAIVLALDLQYVNLQFQLCTVCNSICWAKQSQQQLHYRFLQPHFLYAVHERSHFLLIWQQVQVLAQSTFGCIRQDLLPTITACSSKWSSYTCHRQLHDFACMQAPASDSCAAPHAAVCVCLIHVWLCISFFADTR